MTGTALKSVTWFTLLRILSQLLSIFTLDEDES